jgi:type I restriction enzyme S subunit
MRKGWTETTLGEHIEIVMGQAPPGKDCNKNGIGVPFVKAGEFTDVFPVVREWTTNPLRFAKISDTLICVVGATCGKLTKGIDCAIGRSVAALRPLDMLEPGFLWYFMTIKVQEMRIGSRGSAQGVITKDDIASLKMWLPPLEEQKRIVDVVSSVDAYIHALSSSSSSSEVSVTADAISSARRLRTALLFDLLSGSHSIPDSYDKFLGSN